MPLRLVVENIVIYCCTTVLVGGLAWLTHSWWSLFGLWLLRFVNLPVNQDTKP